MNVSVVPSCKRKKFRANVLAVDEPSAIEIGEQMVNQTRKSLRTKMVAVTEEFKAKKILVSARAGRQIVWL